MARAAGQSRTKSGTIMISDEPTACFQEVYHTISSARKIKPGEDCAGFQEFRGGANGQVGHSTSPRRFIVARDFRVIAWGEVSMGHKFVTVCGMIALSAGSMFADFSYQETSKITGGVMAGMMKVAGVFSKTAREPIESTVAVKGNRMVHRSATHVSMIDLDSKTITDIDFQKKQYSVMTFDEMKQAMEQMSKKMKKDDNGEMKFKVSANATGKTKQVSGLRRQRNPDEDGDGDDRREEQTERRDGGLHEPVDCG